MLVRSTGLLRVGQPLGLFGFFGLLLSLIWASRRAGFDAMWTIQSGSLELFEL